MSVRTAGAAAAVLVASVGVSIASADETSLTTLQAEGMRAFHARCDYCHLDGGTGTIMLGRRLGAEKALLDKRIDLDAVYVRTIVRTGIKSMPALTRVEVPDVELATIADYLARASPPASGSR